MRKPQFIVYEQTVLDADLHRVNDCFGPFRSYDRAAQLCKKLQSRNPEHWYGIRELLTGATWMQD